MQGTSDPERHPLGLHGWLAVPLFFVVYVIGAEFGEWLSVDGRFTTFWPNSGLYLAVLLLAPWRRWPVFVATALAANLTTDILLVDRTLPVAAGFALANTVEAMVAAALIRRWIGRMPTHLQSLNDFGKACATATLAGAPLGAAIGGWTVAAIYTVPFHEAWATWWIADALGVVLVAPLVLSLTALERWPPRQQLLEGALLVILLVAAGHWFAGGDRTMPPAALLLFLLWAAVRLGVPGVAITTLVLAVLAVRYAQLVPAIVSSGLVEPLERVREVQAFIAAAALLAYGFAIVLQQRRLDQWRSEQETAARNSAERRDTEEALLLRKAQLDLTLSATGIGLWLNTMPLGRLDWDARSRELFFLGPDEEPTVELFYERLHPDDREPTRVAVDEALRERKLYQIEHRAVNPRTGEERWVRSVGQATYADDGTPVRFNGINYDITDRKRDEQRLRLSEERFRRLAASMPQLVFTADVQGQITYTNEHARQYAGVDDLSGDKWVAGVHADDRDGTLRRWTEGIRAGQPFEFKNRYRRADGEYRWLLCRTLPTCDERGRIVEWVGACADVDDLMRLQQELQESARRKDEFLAILAHELRNPLAPVRHGLELLKRNRGDAQASAAALAMMERQVAQMTRLIDELLDLSRISRGKIVLQRQPVDLRDALRHALETVRPEVEAQAHVLETTLAPEPLQVDGDPTRLAQIFANLLFNSARYTARGGRISVSAQRHGDEAHVTVADNGMGIPGDMLERIFEMFTQVNRPLESGSQGGLGIGLSIVDRLVRMHGGRVEAHSDGPGCGSRFIVALPLVATRELPAVVPEAPVAVEPAVRRRVLVADDNADAAVSLAMLLELMGHEVRIARDGMEAVTASEAFRPDAIVLDIGMPQLNGYEVCRRIRSRAWAGETLIIAATGWGQDNDRRRSAEAGFDAHLTKPVDPDTIERLIASHRRPAEA